MFCRPNVFISKCIEQDNCRYDGSKINSPFVKKIKGYVNIITVCPEVAIGLSIPREAIRIIEDGQNERLVYSKSGTDVTESMNNFTISYINTLNDKNIHGFILKNSSPSCGLKNIKVYQGIGKMPSLGRKTIGFFGKAVLENYSGVAIEDEGRLMNYDIRDYFLTKIFSMCSFDEVIKNQTIRSLIKFHSRNKYLLMAYNQSNQNKLGQIVANHSDEPIDIVIKKYHQLLEKTVSKPLKRGTNINMLMHLLGYFKKVLKKEEKAYFLDILEQYSQKKIPFSVPIAVIYSWTIRFNETYLIEQTIFKPYPLEILDLSDSGKGIEYE